MEDRGPSFAMVIGEPDVDNDAVGMPPENKQSVMVEVPIVNTCTLAAVDVDLSNVSKTTVRYGCLDMGSAPHTTIDVSLNIVTGPTLNKDRSPIVAITFRHPDKIKN
ncbi:hypothetical protein HQ487_03750 [Candidatus Uhrbacteria bacterium]|nr:hypothetical protein [Candidatus Uhrbacteria bacterium]